MEQAPVATLSEHFSELIDPRTGQRRDHKLVDIVDIAICAVICGADTWVDVENFGKAKLNWFKTFLELPNGIPSHDTFGRVFAHIDPEEFQSCFLSWMQAVSKLINAEVMALDGKKLRRSHDRTLGKAAIHMVSAWATANRLVLGQTKVDDKSNEITAMPELLQVLELSGCVVTIDAMGCQKEIAKTIIEKEADYVLALKGNQGHLQEDVAQVFDEAQETAFQDNTHDYHQTVNGGHGRIEIRDCWTMPVPEWADHIRNLEAWKDFRTIVKVVSERRAGDKTSVEARYFISSLESDAKRLLEAIRAHWGIENGLHWVLDIAFREDESRIRKGNGPQNFAVLRHIALNLLKQEKTAKCGIKAKRLKAAWDEDYLLKVLAGLVT